jgi:hypothetical protein
MSSKGWEQYHVNRATSILQNADTVKTGAIRFLDAIIYWVILFAAIVGNFIVSIVFIPVLLAFDELSAVVAVAVFAVAFGTLLDFIVREVEHLRRSHLIVPELFIPAIALINIYIIVRLSNGVAVSLDLPTHNPWLISIMYVCAFVLPHFALKWRRSRLGYR